MTAFTEKLDRAAGAALCEGLTVTGQSLIGAGAVSLVLGGAGAVPIAFGAAALMAAEAGCTWDSAGPGPSPTTPPIDICKKAASPTRITTKRNGNPTDSTPYMTEIYGVVYESTDPCTEGKGADVYRVTGITPSGASVNQVLRSGSCGPFPAIWTQEFEGDPTCEVPIDPGPGDPTIPPYEYTDPVDGCSLTVYTEGWATDELGSLNPVYRIEPASNLRQGGGVIGGCNFSPVIYTGNPGGPGEPPIIRPWDPIWDDPGPGGPLWAPFLREVLAGLASNALLEIIEQVLETPKEPITYQLASICEIGPTGQPETRFVEVDIPALNGIDAVIARLDALPPLLQGQKDFKQPVCPPAKAAGDLRTISFRSEEVSPNGKSCLRKRLRYRSLSGIGLGALIDHWKDFSFSAGPVIVKNIGSTCGSLTVWASSVDEGKRVILHAFAEAGVDANQAGRWEVSSSTSTRRGMPGTMNIDITGGYYWITARDGSSQRPIVGKT